ncbi:hypothetical protein NOX27_24240 [Enterobacter kobei]|uniref:hypothetical protein n=1 Tax=Enterobacteriaceae TaxID=543 RepID=UPI00210EDD6F|nr:MULTISPECIES: hypothetical protein [Enterobacteriaceae]MCQ4359413.1 hypothetical protein [Enterobacter kobei]MDC3552135.1 hypothetical protein [Escherichia coli]HDC4314704.1 hypothetical protein [Enterobacter kobei]HDC4328033.1 hypothetical protein [Enterobacter kobei]HDC4425575.1 hypothetical protein [Enterobacter kobei]
MKFQPIPEIKNPDTEAFAQKMAREYQTHVQRHQKGTDIYTQAYGIWKTKIDMWLKERTLVRWEVLALSDRIVSLIGKA